MKTKYDTLDDFLDALDAVKEKVAEETQGMTTKQVKAYFAGAVRELERSTGQKLRLRGTRRRISTIKS